MTDPYNSPDIALSPEGHPVYRDYGGEWVQLPEPAPPVDVPPEDLEEAPDPAEASNVVDGTAHHLLITPDPGEPDMCAGCGQEWPCPDAVRLRAAELPTYDTDPEQQRLSLVALNAARDALGLAPFDPTQRHYQ